MSIARVGMCVAAALATFFSSGDVAAQDFRACVSGLRATALASGISAQTFDAAMKGVEPDPTVLESMDAQPEFKTPLWDYMATLVDDQRIAEGRDKFKEWGAVLEAAETRFGVDRHV